jgi:hypothetical protein
LDYLHFLTCLSRGGRYNDLITLAVYELPDDKYLWLSIYSCTRKLYTVVILFAGIITFAIEGTAGRCWVEEMTLSAEQVTVLRDSSGQLFDLLHMLATLADILNLQSGRLEEDAARKNRLYKQWASCVGTCKLLLLCAALFILSTTGCVAYCDFLIYMSLCALLAGSVQYCMKRRCKP